MTLHFLRMVRAKSFTFLTAVVTLLLTQLLAAEPLLTGGTPAEAALGLNSTFTLSVWNIHKEQTPQFRQEFDQLLKDSEFICLQEVQLSHDVKSRWNLSSDFVWNFASAWDTGDGPTGTAVLSRFQAAQGQAVISDYGEPLVSTPKSSVVLYFPLKDSHEKLMLISTHSLNFTFLDFFEDQLYEVASLIENHQGPVIWAGDFNTWSDGRWTSLHALAHSLNLMPVLMENQERWMILDHVFARDLQVNSARLLTDRIASDHWPLQVQFQFSP